MNGLRLGIVVFLELVLAIIGVAVLFQVEHSWTSFLVLPILFVFLGTRIYVFFKEL
jgi:hypothetical protein